MRTWFLLAIVAAMTGPEISACDGALANLTGRKRFTARLSSNAVIRRQQLIVDPDDILGGSASVRYDPTLVRLVELQDPADYAITGGVVGVKPPTGSGLGTQLLPLDQFFTPQGIKGTQPIDRRESGFVQIFFDLRGNVSLTPFAKEASVIPNDPGYTTVAEDGPTGVNDTHALLFEYLPFVSATTVASYTVYATGPLDGTTSDSIIPAADPSNPIPYTEIGESTVAGSLGELALAVPLPPGVWTGGTLLAALGAVNLLRLRSRNRQ